MQSLPKEYLIAMDATIEAAAEILRFYNSSFETEIKSDGSPVTEADLASSKIISSHLEQTGIPIIGEERTKTDYDTRKTWTQNWCVDPLDGTKEFVKHNGEFCISIAHIKNGKSVFGILTEPCKHRMLYGGHETGVYLWNYKEDPNKEKVQKLNSDAVLGDEIVWIGSRSHEGADAKWIEKLSKTFQTVKKIPKGSAVKFFDLALKNAHIYPRFAPTMEWDIAAGQAILEALGGTIVDVHTGETLCYNKASLYNPFFIAKTAAFIAREKKINKQN